LTTVVSLADVVDIASGQVDPRDALVARSLHVGGDNIEAGTGRLSGMRPASELGMISGKYAFTPRDVLYSKIRPALNKVALPDFEGICSADIYPIRARAERLERRYLAHLLRTPAFLDFALGHSARTNIPKINREALLSYAFPLPALPQQRRIADILDKADAIRRKRREAIALAEELLRSAFLEMFGDPVGNPRGWPTESIADLCARGGALVDGPFGSSLKPESYVSAGARVVRNWNIRDDYFDGSQFKFVTLAKFEELRRSEVVQGDLLLTTKGTVGDICVAPDLGGPALLSASGTVRLRLPQDGSYLPEFVVAQAITPRYKAYLHSFEAGSAQQYLNLSAIRKMRIIRPPVSKQLAFVDIRSKTVSLRQTLETSSSEAGSLFDGLSNRFFSGGARP
jgi:type I restriction enzyme S subunit